MFSKEVQAAESQSFRSEGTVESDICSTFLLPLNNKQNALLGALSTNGNELGDDTVSRKIETEDDDDCGSQAFVDDALNRDKTYIAVPLPRDLCIGGKESFICRSESSLSSSSSEFSSSNYDDPKTEAAPLSTPRNGAIEENLRIEVSKIEFDSEGHFFTKEMQTPARLPPPEKDTDKFHFISKQFLIESEIFYRTTGGKIIYDQSKKKFVACFSDRKDEDCLNYDAIRSFLRRLMKNGLGLVACILSFYGRIRENSLSVVVYARCKYDTHNQRFKFEMNNIHLTLTTISVYATEHKGDIVHDGLPIMEQLRGTERDDIKRIVVNTQPIAYYDEVLQKTDTNRIREGDYGQIRNLPVYNQLRAEMKNEKKRYITSSDVSDIMQRYKEDQMGADPYIRRVGEPFHVHMFSREQLDTVTRNDKVAYLDATGSVVRKPDDNLNSKKYEPSAYKRIYYYATIILKKPGQEDTSTKTYSEESKMTTTEDAKKSKKKIMPGIQIPLFEMVTCEQDIASISLLLAKYKIYVHSEKLKWPIFRVVVVDWSWPLINAILKEWTGMSIGMYLKMAYNVVSGNGSLPADLVIIHNCCAHFQHRVSRAMDRNFSKYSGIKSIILDAMGILLQCQTLSDLDLAYENFMRVLMSRSRAEAQKALARLNSMCVVESDSGKDYEDIDEALIEDDEEEELELVDDGFEHGPIFAESPFYNRYFSKLMSIENSVETECSDDDKNEYYAPEIAKYITRTYMPYVPVWSALLLSIVLPGTRKLSNAPAEGYFRILKHDVMKCERNLGIAEFVEVTRNYKSRVCSRADVQKILLRERPIDKQKLLHSRGPDNPLVKEEWRDKKKRKRRGPTHLAARNIGRCIKQEQELSTMPTIDAKELEKTRGTDMKNEAKRKQRKRIRVQASDDAPLAKKSKLSSECLTTSIPEPHCEIVDPEKLSDISGSMGLGLSMDSVLVNEFLTSQSTASTNYSIHPETLKNSLFLDPDYYMRGIDVAPKPDKIDDDSKEAECNSKKGQKIKGETESASLFFYIGQYWCNDTSLIIGSACMNLCSEDYLSLKEPRYINGSVIDCFAIGMLSAGKWKDVTYVPTVTTIYLVGDNGKGKKLKRGPQWVMYHIKTPLKGVILLPYTWKEHWRLLILDVDKRTIHVLDPIRMKARDTKRATREFKKYLAECRNRKNFDTNNLCDIEWTVIDATDKRPLQKDGYNCGAYVMYYLNCIATSQPMDGRYFDPGLFRRQVSRELLGMSHSMRHVCYLCAAESYAQSVQCETCKRYIHLKCVRLCEHDETDYLVEHTARYTCALCKTAERP